MNTRVEKENKMELLETQDPEKKRLIETSNRHREELERELDGMGDRSQKMLKKRTHHWRGVGSDLCGG